MRKPRDYDSIIFIIEFIIVIAIGIYAAAVYAVRSSSERTSVPIESPTSCPQTEQPQNTETPTPETVKVTPEPTEEQTEEPTSQITEVVIETPFLTPKPILTPIIVSTPEPEWMYYLATSYSLGDDKYGNMGDDLTGKKVVAAWQTGLDYGKSCVEPFRTFYRTHRAEDYGGLPYGSTIELRVWTGNGYEYLGRYKVLDTSYTTIYALSEVAQSLSGDRAPLRFSYDWPATNYKGDVYETSGLKWGHLPNWKSEYSGKVIGWMDVLDANWGMVIIEVRFV